MDNSILLHHDNMSSLFHSARHIDVECVPHLHSSMEIVIVTDGILNMTIGDCSYRIPKGDAVFVSSYEPHEFHSPDSNTCHVLEFSADLVEYFLEECNGMQPRRHIFSLPVDCASICDRILAAEENTVDYIHAMAVLSPILCEVFEKCEFAHKSAAEHDGFSDILAYMDRHFTEPITLDSVAEAMGIHPVTLSKKFSAHAKTNFSTHLNYLRCNHAAKLIKSTNLTFAEIAFLSGFGSIRSFNRAFRTLFHASPSEFKILPSI